VSLVFAAFKACSSIPDIIVTDQAVYAKALEISSSPSDVGLQRIVLRMGAFHIILNFFAVVGHRFGSAGLRDVVPRS